MRNLRRYRLSLIPPWVERLAVLSATALRATYLYPFSFTLPAAAWTKIVVTVPGDQAGAWVLSGNANGAYLTFDLGAGATFRGPANAWASANYVGATGAVNTCATNGAGFYLTGVKLGLAA